MITLQKTTPGDAIGCNVSKMSSLGRLIFKEQADGSFLISPQAWPKSYLYMDDGSEGDVRWLLGVGGNPGDPGKEAYWRKKNIGDYFLLSTVKWPNWYMYMQDNTLGNICGWEGDPDPQGHWKLTTLPIGSSDVSASC